MKGNWNFVKDVFFRYRILTTLNDPDLSSLKRFLIMNLIKKVIYLESYKQDVNVLSVSIAKLYIKKYVFIIVHF